MITVIPVKDEYEIKKFYAEFNQPFNDFSGVTVARNGDDFLGCCLYEIDNQKIVINFLTPEDDIMLADAFYSRPALEVTLKRLDFIKNEQEKSLKIEKLHESSCCCQKNYK